MVGTKPGKNNIPHALTSAKGVLEIVDSVSAVVFGELGQEGVVVGVIAGLLDDDALLVVAEFVDDVLGLLAELEFVESGDAIIGKADTGRAASATRGRGAKRKAIPGARLDRRSELQRTDTRGGSDGIPWRIR